MKTAKRKHRYMTADTHACVLGLILATITLLALCRYLGIEDITGVLLFPCLFIYPILRCAYDWIFVICSVISVTAKYIFERSFYYVSTFKRHISNGGVNCN